MNRRLAVWIEGEYHQQPHRGLEQQTPLERWAQTASGLRYPDPGLDLDDLFLFEDQRKVQNDRTVSLHGQVFEVDASLIGQRTPPNRQHRCRSCTTGSSSSRPGVSICTLTASSNATGAAGPSTSTARRHPHPRG